MQIDKDLLITWGAVARRLGRNETVFFEGEQARHYFQVLEGEIRMVNYNDEGREFTQGVFSEGQSFGEPPLFLNEPYPSTAIASCDSVVLKLSRDHFLKLLEEFPAIQRSFLVLLAYRCYEKAYTLREIINHSPSERILAFLRSYKRKHPERTGICLIPFTRQEIANFTGLRVETVIRTLTKLREKKQVEIRNRKLYF